MSAPHPIIAAMRNLGIPQYRSLDPAGKFSK
jgi:hypothetical protein